MYCAVKYYSNSKLKDKRYKQKTLPKSYKIEIKILANPGSAQQGFEQTGPEVRNREEHRRRYRLANKDLKKATTNKFPLKAEKGDNLTNKKFRCFTYMALNLLRLASTQSQLLNMSKKDEIQ